MTVMGEGTTPVMELVAGYDRFTEVGELNAPAAADAASVVSVVCSTGTAVLTYDMSC